MNAIIYRRVSTDHQDGSLETQELRLLDYAKFKGLHITATFSDEDTSGGIPLCDRAGGRSLLNHLKHNRETKAVIVAKLDRLGRNTRDFLQTLETFESLGVTLHITDFGGDSISTQGHWGRMILTILAAVAEAERGEIRDRVKKRLDTKFNKNELTGTVPYGYDCLYTFANGLTLIESVALSQEDLAILTAEHGPIQSKQLLPNQEEIAQIQFMQSWRNAGLIYKSIAKNLNDMGIPTKTGAQWRTSTVESILKSKHTASLLAENESRGDAEAQSAITELQPA